MHGEQDSDRGGLLSQLGRKCDGCLGARRRCAGWGGRDVRIEHDEDVSEPVGVFGRGFPGWGAELGMGEHKRCTMEFEPRGTGEREDCIGELAEDIRRAGEGGDSVAEGLDIVGHESIEDAEVQVVPYWVAAGGGNGEGRCRGWSERGVQGYERGRGGGNLRGVNGEMLVWDRVAHNGVGEPGRGNSVVGEESARNIFETEVLDTFRVGLGEVTV